MDVGKLKNDISWKHIKKVLINFALKKVDIFIFIIMFAITGFFVYLWYSCIYRPQWSDVKKQEYIKNKDKGVVFNKNLFENIATEFDLRNQEFEKNGEPLEDIFRLKR